MPVKYIFILFIFSIIQSVFIPLYSQKEAEDTVSILTVTDNVPDSLMPPQNLVWEPCISPFIELLGKGFLSFNVDFRRKESSAISIGLQPLEGLMPNIMYYHFSGEQHRVELGGGLSGGFSKNFNLSGILIHGVFGYRYQKKGGLFFRAGFTPLYVIFFSDKERSNKLYPFVGVSLGYSF